jgi:hypothetical protein
MSDNKNSLSDTKKLALRASRDLKISQYYFIAATIIMLVDFLVVYG